MSIEQDAEYQIPRAGGYTLDLYCRYSTSEEGELSAHDSDNYPLGEYAHEFGSKCRTQARRDGWILHRNGLSTCPDCAKQIKRDKP